MTYKMERLNEMCVIKDTDRNQKVRHMKNGFEDIARIETRKKKLNWSGHVAKLIDWTLTKKVLNWWVQGIGCNEDSQEDDQMM